MYNNYNPYAYSVQNASQQLIRVTGIEGARAFQMMPNCAAALFDSSDDIMYIKTTDGAGFGTIRIFNFSELKAQPEPQKAYVTREEFDKLRKELEDAKQLISRSAEAHRSNDTEGCLSESD